MGIPAFIGGWMECLYLGMMREISNVDGISVEGGYQL
jgi:hypothetical protein